MLALKLIDESREIKNIIFAGKILIDLITKYCYMKKKSFYHEPVGCRVGRGSGRGLCYLVITSSRSLSMT